MELSIVSINKNDSCGLDETIRSVKNQNYKEFEYIIVDGKSSDDSVAVIKRHAADGLKIKWISEEDSGIFDAMNKGIKMASGKYLLFLNSGDTLDSDSVIGNVLKDEHHADVLIGECRVMDNGKQVWMQRPKERYTLRCVLDDSIPHQSSFIKKELFDRFGLYRSDLRIMGDWEFFLRAIILGGCTVEPLNMVVSKYNTEGVSSDPKNKTLILEEKESVFTDLHLNNIVPDYRQIDCWLNNNEAILWAAQKKWFKGPIGYLYRLARLVKQKRA